MRQALVSVIGVGLVGWVGACGGESFTGLSEAAGGTAGVTGSGAAASGGSDPSGGKADGGSASGGTETSGGADTSGGTAGGGAASGGGASGGPTQLDLTVAVEGSATAQARQGSTVTLVIKATEGLEATTAVTVGRGWPCAVASKSVGELQCSVSIPHGAALGPKNAGLPVDVVVSAATKSTAAKTLTVTAFHVATTGSDSTGGGTPSKPYRSVTKAVAESAAGDAIIIAAGTYTDGADGELFPLTNTAGKTLQADGQVTLTTADSTHKLFTDQGGESALSPTRVIGLTLTKFYRAFDVSAGHYALDDLTVGNTTNGAIRALGTATVVATNLTVANGTTAAPDPVGNYEDATVVFAGGSANVTIAGGDIGKGKPILWLTGKATLKVRGTAAKPVLLHDSQWDAVVIDSADPAGSGGADFDYVDIGRQVAGILINSHSVKLNHTVIHDGNSGVYMVAPPTGLRGKLTARNSTFSGNYWSGVDLGSTQHDLDLGTSADPGNNVFKDNLKATDTYSDNGQLAIRGSDGDTNITAYGNTFIYGINQLIGKGKYTGPAAALDSAGTGKAYWRLLSPKSTINFGP